MVEITLLLTFLQKLSHFCIGFYKIYHTFVKNRHTFATRCISNGCDPKTLSLILGHASVNITLNRYVHPSYDDKVRFMDSLKPMV